MKTLNAKQIERRNNYMTHFHIKQLSNKQSIGKFTVGEKIGTATILGLFYIRQELFALVERRCDLTVCGIELPTVDGTPGYAGHVEKL